MGKQGQMRQKKDVFYHLKDDKITHIGLDKAIALSNPI